MQRWLVGAGLGLVLVAGLAAPAQARQPNPAAVGDCLLTARVPAVDPAAYVIEGVFTVVCGSTADVTVRSRLRKAVPGAPDYAMVAMRTTSFRAEAGRRYTIRSFPYQGRCGEGGKHYGSARITVGSMSAVAENRVAFYTSWVGCQEQRSALM